MSLFKDAKNFILENELKIIYLKNKINIVNYKNVVGFDSDKIVVDCNEMLVIITGTNLVISKLLLDELLVSGKIEKVEFR